MKEKFISAKAAKFLSLSLSLSFFLSLTSRISISIAFLTSMSSKAASTEPLKSLCDLNLYHSSFGGKLGGE